MYVPAGPFQAQIYVQARETIGRLKIPKFFLWSKTQMSRSRQRVKKILGADGMLASGARKDKSGPGPLNHMSTPQLR